MSQGITGQRRFTTKAYLTYVAIDEEGKAISVPELILETDDDKKRFEEARIRSLGRKDLLNKIRMEIEEK